MKCYTHKAETQLQFVFTADDTLQHMCYTITKRQACLLIGVRCRE